MQRAQWWLVLTLRFSAAAAVPVFLRVYGHTNDSQLDCGLAITAIATAAAATLNSALYTDAFMNEPA
jgi:hypothetical protein